MQKRGGTYWGFGAVVWGVGNQPEPILCLIEKSTKKARWLCDIAV